MVSPAPKQRRKKLNVLIMYSIDPESADSETPTRAQTISRSARLRVADGVNRDIARVLNEAGFRATFANIEDYLERLRDALVVERPDLIINRVEEFEGDFNEYAMAIPSRLAIEGYAYTGSDSICLGNCGNRVHTLLFLADAGIATPKFASIYDMNSIPNTDGFSYPLIISQALDDIYEEEGLEHPLYDREQVEARTVELSTEYSFPLLVEEFIEGRLVHAIVLGNRTLEVLPLIEAVDEAVEYKPPAQPHVDRTSTVMEIQAEVFDMLATDHFEVAQFSQNTVDQVRSLACRAFRAMGCRDGAMIDFHITPKGEPYVIKVRPMLNLGRLSAFGVAATHTESGYEEMLVKYVTIACERYRMDPRGELLRPRPVDAPDLAAVPPSTDDESTPPPPQ